MTKIITTNNPNYERATKFAAITTFPVLQVEHLQKKKTEKSHIIIEDKAKGSQ